MSHNSYSDQDLDFPSAVEAEEHHEWYCDWPGCDQSHSGDGEFTDLWDDAKKAGWRCYKNKLDDWKHFCQKHAKERNI